MQTSGRLERINTWLGREGEAKCPRFQKMIALLPEKDYLFDSIEGFEAEDYPLEGFKADGNSRPCTDVINDCKCLLYFVYMLNV